MLAGADFTLCKRPSCLLEAAVASAFPGSSAVEQPAVNRLVAGSNPARGAIAKIRALFSHDFFRFLSNLATGLTLNVPVFIFSMAERASRFRSTVLV
jgi:hypothetical protein